MANNKTTNNILEKIRLCEWIESTKKQVLRETGNNISNKGIVLILKAVLADDNFISRHKEQSNDH